MENKKQSGFGRIFWLLLAIGICVKIYGAWLMRFSMNGDYGVVGLMARHMSEGRDFPLFFYGQAYMGSLEPMISAIFCKLFGVSGFSVNLGTALFGVLLLPVVYAIARDIAGRTAGLIAMSMCIIGPGGFFHYMGSPRGGYALTVLFYMLILWLSAKTIVRDLENKSAGHYYFAIGLLAGLAFWTNQLAMPAVVAAAVAFIIFLRKDLLNPGILHAIAGGIAGSLPFWIWNLQHGWKSFAIGNSLETFKVADKFQLLVGTRFLQMFDLADKHLSVCVMTGLIYGLTLALAVSYITRCRQDRNNKLPLVLWSLLLISVPVYAVVFSISTFAWVNTPRYLLPLVPVSAVALGVVTAGFATRAPLAVRLLPVIFLVTLQANNIRAYINKEKDSARELTAMQNMMPDIKKTGTTAIFVDQDHYAYNFHNHESFLFCHVKGERYAPYQAMMNLQSDIGVLNNTGCLDSFLKNTASYCNRLAADGITVDYNIKSSRPACREIDPSGYRIRDSNGRDVSSVLNDSTLKSLIDFNSYHMLGSKAFLDITFDKPTEVCMCRMQNGETRFPEKIAIDGIDENGNRLTVTPPTRFTFYYWSGTRIFHGGSHFRFDVYFKPVRLKSMRIRMTSGNTVSTVSEMKLFAAQGSLALPDANVISNICRTISDKKIKRIYCDSWESGRISEETDGSIWTPSFKPTSIDDNEYRIPFRITKDTGVLIPAENTCSFSNFLQRAMIHLDVQNIGSYHLYTVPGNASCPTNDIEAVWNGCAANFISRKGLAHSLYLNAARETHSHSGSTNAIIDLLRKAVAEYPNHKPAADMLHALTGPETSSIAWTPAINAPIKFANGVELLGLDIAPLPLKAGRTVKVKYYWRVDTDFKSFSCAAFLHFRNGHDIPLQDDHCILEDADTAFQPFSEIFVEEREISVPAGITPGKYEVTIGLLDSKHHNSRIKASTPLKKHKNEVTIAEGIEITK